MSDENKKTCNSCEKFVEISEGEWNCAECERKIAEERAHYKPIYDGEVIAGFHNKE